MRYLHVEEALGLSSSIKKYESPRINAVSSRVVSTKSMGTIARGIFSMPIVQISNSFLEKSEVYCMMGYYVDASVEWCCEECDIRKGIMFSSSGLENVHYEGLRFPFFEKICQRTVQPKKHSKYCMMGYYVESLVDWCCEECDIGKEIMFSSSGLENVHYERPRLSSSEKICQSNMQPKKHSKFPGGHRIN
ncbi:hypothetical protein H5410_001343 [Solanum commersonii]|uniref:Uncharacterized protein n=1 Tax=Solanum commersonii TaxID=4109 RepID=A0A9J6AZA2_SOLCO|nr:hypothetical protein H5410_001343 [Solanum commersonii]